MKSLNFKGIVLVIVSMIINVTGYSQNGTTPIAKLKKDTLIVDDTCRLVQTVYYTCPAHPKVRSEKAGNCPQCGTTLDKRKEALYYSCPVHSEVQHNQKGNCDKCGSELKEEHKPILK